MKMFEKFDGFKLGFPAEIHVFGLYRKVREGSRSISSNFHRNRTTGDLANTQKRHSPIIVLFSFIQYTVWNMESDVQSKNTEIQRPEANS